MNRKKFSNFFLISKNRPYEKLFSFIHSFIRLSIAGLLLFACRAEAQITTCSHPAAPFVTAVEAPNLDCEALTYRLYFETSAPSDEIGFTANYLSVTGQLSSDGNAASIDLGQSSSLFGDIIYDAETGNFSITYSDPAVADFIPVCNQGGNAIAEYATIYVNAPPGTTNLSLTVNNGETIFSDDSEICTFFNNPPVPSINVPALPPCTESGGLTFVTPDFANPSLVGVNLNYEGAQSVEFAFEVEDVYDNLPETVFEIDEDIYVFTDLGSFLLSNGNRRFAGIITNAGGGIIIPENIAFVNLGQTESGLENEAAQANLTFEYIKIISDTECCTPPIPAVFSADIGGTQIGCTEEEGNFTFSYDFFPGSENQNPTIEVYFPAGIPNDYDQLFLSFLIETEGMWNVTISSSDIDCPDNTACPFHPEGNEAGECFDINPVEEGYLVDLGFCNLGVVGGGGFVIDLMPVSGDPGCCIGNIGFQQAFIDLAGPGGDCVPNVEPVSDANFCKEDGMITGSVTWFDLDDNTAGVSDILFTTQVGTTDYVSAPTACDEGTFAQNYDIADGMNAVVSAEAVDMSTTGQGGLTTFDLVIIRQHILTTTLFTSKYQWIAADANDNYAVTTADVVLLRQAILNPDSPTYPASSWRFVNADVELPEADADPHVLTQINTEYGGYSAIQSVNLDFTVSENQADFIGIKTGDVNFTDARYCDSGGFTGGDGGEFIIEINDTQSEDDGYRLTFDLKSTVPRTGFQAGLGFDITELAYDYLEITSELDEFTEENEFAVFLTNEGKLNFLWITPDGQAKPVNSGIEDFTVKFQSDLSETELLDKLTASEGERSYGNLNESLLYLRDEFKNVAYDADGNETDIRLTIAPRVIRKLSGEPEPALFAPNPFGNSLRLSDNTALPDGAVITFYNQLGKRMNTERVHTFDVPFLQNTETWSAGLYYYTVESGNRRFSGKLVKM